MPRIGLEHVRVKSALHDYVNAAAGNAGRRDAAFGRWRASQPFLTTDWQSIVPLSPTPSDVFASNVTLPVLP